MNDFIDSFAYWLADFYLLSTILLAAALAAMWCLKQPVKRLAVAKSVLVATALLAVLCALPGWSAIHLLAGRASVPPMVQSPTVSNTPSIDAAVPIPPTVANEHRSAPPRSLPELPHDANSVSLTALFGLAHWAGSACVLAWLGAGAFAARRLLRDSQPAPIELSRLFAQIAPAQSRGFDLLVSDRIDVAVAIGVTRPCVVLPHYWVDDRSAEELQTVLAHEVAHVQNGDLAWLALGRLLLVLLWAQPLYWLLRRSLRLDQEALADAAAAEHAGRRQYAEQLVAWARDVAARPRLSLPAAMGLWEGPSQLRRRVALLLDERLTMLRRCSRTWIVSAIVFLVSSAMLLSLATFEPSAATEAVERENVMSSNQPEPITTKVRKSSAWTKAAVRTLPTGTRVEILAIGINSDTTSADRWWRPDGTPLVSVPFSIGGVSVSQSDLQLARQFVMLVPGSPPGATVRWSVVDAPSTAYYGRIMTVDGESNPRGYYSVLIHFAQRQANFGLRVDVAAGEWKTIAKPDPQGEASIEITNHESVAYTQAFAIAVPHWGKSTAVEISHTPFDQTDVRMVAIDKAGKQHTADQTSNSTRSAGNGVADFTQFDFRGLKPEDIDHFELQTRDFQSVQFNELPTQPDTNRPSVEFQALAPEASLKEETVADDELAGVAQDGKGKPLAGVTVDAWTWFPGNETVTDDAGRFSLKGFDIREPVELQFTKPGFCPRLFIAQPVGEANWVVTLNDRTFLEGRVLDPNDEPVAGINIRATRGPFAPTDGSRIDAVWTETESDADGRYRMYLEPDTYELRVRQPGVGVARYEKTVVRENDHREFDLQLKAGPTFRARVIDSQTDEPVAGIRLFQWREAGIAGSSNEDGELEIVNMLPGPYEFNVSADGEKSKFSEVAGAYARWWSPDALKQWQRCELDDGRDRPQQNFGFQRNFDDLEFDIRAGMSAVPIFVERCVKIRGRVDDPEGNPVVGATVSPAKTGSGNSLTGDTRYSVRTAADGTFEMRLPASGAAKYNLVAHDGDYEQWRTWANGIGELLQTKPGDVIENVKLQLSRPCIVRGRVQDANGKPAANHRVQAQASDKRGNRYYDPTSETNERGEFELRFVRPGKHYVQAEPFWMAAEDGPKGAWQLVVAQPEHPTDGVILTLPPVTAESRSRFQMHVVLPPQSEDE